jgi:hypothetical protein
MATLLKYENGLLLPVGKTSEVYKPVVSSGLGADSKSGENMNSFKKVINILILVTVAINTLLTIAVAAKLS